MIYLIVYDRSTAETLSVERFDESDRVEAENCRLQLELLPSNRNENREVVLLQASSERELLETHARYFNTVREMNTLLNETLIGQLSKVTPH